MSAEEVCSNPRHRLAVGPGEEGVAPACGIGHERGIDACAESIGGELVLGAEPVGDGISRRGPSGKIDLIGAETDLLVAEGSCGVALGFASEHRWRPTLGAAFERGADAVGVVPEAHVGLLIRCGRGDGIH